MKYRVPASTLAGFFVSASSTCMIVGSRYGAPLTEMGTREKHRAMAWWLPIVIFLAETCVVTFSTLRTIFVARGMKPFAACLGLVEASIWLFAIGQVVSNLQHVPCSIAYALGFVCGNYLGMTIEEMLAIGTQVVRIITAKQPD